MTTTRVRGLGALAVLVAALAWAAWTVAETTPGAEGAVEVLAWGAAGPGLGGLAWWAARRPWRWEAAKLLAKALLIAVAASVALATIAWLSMGAAVALVGLAEQVRLLFAEAAEAVDATAPELAKVLVMGAALYLVCKWNPKKRRGRRGRRR